ncbi:MAG: cadherin-like beta sandwich domain-containing protein [Ruminococcaceae bacterium]|nr:cadherin-like beta sandwich domain-containing protein [Oscillospiraceae bacterium]
MRKFLSIFLAIILIVSIVPVMAFASTGSLSMSGTPRPGAIITVKLYVKGTIGGYEGTLKYDSSILTLQSIRNSGGSNWAGSFVANGDRVVAYRKEGTTDTLTAFTATFRVNNGVSAGTNAKVSFEGIASANGVESNISCSVSKKVEPPLSGDATLHSLVVSNATLSPAFSANSTEYNCGTVSFDVAKLNITATATEGAKVSISGADLSVGANTITIEVTAPNGAKKTYTINVTREQDPNYVPSNNIEITGITLSAGVLSPEFAINRKEYVVYLPYEQTIISIDATPADPLAFGVEGVTDAELKVGINEFVIKVTAEDGTVGEYKIYVVRMPQFINVGNIGIVEKEPDAKDSKSPLRSDGVPPILIGVSAVVCLIFGFAIGAGIMRCKYRKMLATKNDDHDSNNEPPAPPSVNYGDRVQYIDYQKYLEDQNGEDS